MAARMSASTRTIWIMALTAVLSLAAGLGLSRLIVSPAQAAANAAPPEAGAITVPVEQRTLANDIVMRGTAGYEDPEQVTLETSDIGGSAVVTGGVPEVGATLDAGAVMLEVTGRPVILLTGELPVYRTLRAGVSGPDVVQLKEALAALGIDAGDPLSSTYDAATAAGVRELYARVGYPAPSAGEEAEAALEAARDAVRAAEEGVDTASREVSTAGRGAPQSERLQLQNAVDVAQARLDQARAACAAPTAAMPCDPVAVVEAEGALDIAIAARAEGTAAPDTSGPRAALASAQRALAQAEEDLAKASSDVITPLPASEVVYLPSTPRRVDSVEVKRGSEVGGTAVMSVSGASLEIVGNLPDSDAELVTEGTEVLVELPSGGEVVAAVTAIGGEDEQDADGGDPAEDAGRTRVVVVPVALTEEERLELQGVSVRMTIPVSSTQGEVLAVPTAALTAGPGGEARVEVLEEDGETTRLVEVEAGLAAEGFVEVTAADGSLQVGDRVVVGVSAGTPAAGDEEEADAAEEDA